MGVLARDLAVALKVSDEVPAVLNLEAAGLRTLSEMLAELLFCCFGSRCAARFRGPCLPGHPKEARRAPKEAAEGRSGFH